MTTLLEPPTSAPVLPLPAPAATPHAPAASAPAASASAPAAPARTPRDTSIDVARAWCLVVVVGLHSIMVGVSVVNGTAVLENAMDGWGGFAALTWFIQVMPLFFVLGGFSSATQWARLRADGVRAHAYVAMRMQRLLPPALAAMGATAIALLALVVAGVPGEVVAIAGFRMSQALWFLGVYLLCTGLVPLMTALHRAAPRLTLVVLGALVLGVDGVRIGTGIAELGFANLLFVWLLLQQLGFFLAEGRIPSHRRTLVLGTLGAFGALAVLCAYGVYSPDLFENLNPPTMALVLLGSAQLCLFQLARPLLRTLSGVRTIATVVGAVNARAMTIYSWHMLVLIGLAALLLVTVGEALPAPLTADWWATRPLWFAAVALALVLVVALTGRREAASARTRSVPRLPAGRALSAFLLASGGTVLVLGFGALPAAWLTGAVLLLVSLWATHSRRGAVAAL